MTPRRVTLAMALHCHQPVGNFGWVIREAFERAYRPLIERLEQHPTVHVALHYTGCLLDWFELEEPQFIQRVARLVHRGQVEMIGGGYYEPILPIIPERDRQAQLRLLSETITRLFGQRPCGAWLAERVWEPQLAQTLARAGFDYTIVDDTHIRAARGWSPTLKEPSDVFGFYLTEDEGWTLRLFPSSKRLRYWMPFHPVQDTIEFLRACPDGSLVTFADDGEKFGFWPGTYRWVYEEGWLESWFKALEANAEWLTTMPFRECATLLPPAGQVYLPSMSYEEMVEWSGGNFRNFLVKYPEANLMHKRMLEISRRLDAVEQRHSRRASTAPAVSAVNGHRLSRARLTELARRELYQAQCNCGYWHGVFGGLYLQHLRQSVYRHLITAERWVERLEAPSAKARGVILRDVEGDGQAEVTLTTDELQLIVAPARGAAVMECDVRKAGINLGNTLMRQPEAYHATLAKATSSLVERLVGGGEHPPSIHELLGTKEEGLESLLVYDRYPRWSGIEHFLPVKPSADDLRRNVVRDLVEPLGAYRCWPAKRSATATGPAIEGERLVALPSDERGSHVLRMHKRVALHPKAPQWMWRLHVSHTGDAAPETRARESAWAGWLGVEWNLSLRDARALALHGASHGDSLVLEDADQHLRVTFTADRALDYFLFPIETVSGSEEGLERTYQGLSVWWGSAIHCAPGQPWELRLTQSIETWP